MFNVLRQKIAKAIFSRQIYQKNLSLDDFFVFFVLSFFSGVTFHIQLTFFWGGQHQPHDKSAGPDSDFIPVARGCQRCGSLSNGL